VFRACVCACVRACVHACVRVCYFTLRPVSKTMGSDINEWIWSIIGNNLTRRKHCPSATVSKTSHNSQMELSRKETRPPRWQTGKWLPETYRHIECSIRSSNYCFYILHKLTYCTINAPLHPLWATNRISTHIVSSAITRVSLTL